MVSPAFAQAIDWVQWALALPWSTGPINDATGASCAMGQQGPVWYLAGTTGAAGGSVMKRAQDTHYRRMRLGPPANALSHSGAAPKAHCA